MDRMETAEEETTRRERARRWLALARVPHAVGERVVAEARRIGLARAWEEPELLRDESHDWPAAFRQAAERLEDAEDEIRRAEAAGARVVDVDHPEYPVALAAIDDAPPVLFVLGRILPSDARSVAVIGSREATSYGLRMVRRFVPPLAAERVTIVSGMARGIDAASHRAALEGGARTIAVLATGIDVCYPRSSADLYRRIPEHGAIVTEMPPGTQAEPRLFPIRNRIISGIARAVLVVEARSQSGTTSTAGHAQRQGREVGAVPGDVDVGRSDGTNQLLQSGCASVMRVPADVLETLLGEPQPSKSGPRRRAAPAGLAVPEAAVYAALSEEPQPIDVLLLRTRLAIAPLLASLSILELRGLAHRNGDGRYALVVNRGGTG